MSLLFCSISAHCQFIPGVKHIEIISEIQDSMVLLNKPDVDKINKTYFEKSKLDSLNVYNEQTINLLENKIFVQDSIINNQKLLLYNEVTINTHLRKNLEDNTTQYEKQLKDERLKKIGWQVGIGVATIGIVLALVLK